MVFCLLALKWLINEYKFHADIFLIELAVYRAIYAEVNAQLQMQAAALGPINFLNEEEAALAAASTEGQIERAWSLWCGAIRQLDNDQKSAVN